MGLFNKVRSSIQTKPESTTDETLKISKSSALNLSEQESLAFYGALFAMAAADGSVDPEEAKLIINLINLDSLSESTKRQLQSYLILPPDLETCLNQLSGATAVVKERLILYFIEIALACEGLSKEEKKAMKLAKAKLKVSESKFKELKNFVYKMKEIAAQDFNNCVKELTESPKNSYNLTQGDMNACHLLNLTEDPNAILNNSVYYSDEKFTRKIQDLMVLAGRKVLYNALLLYLTSKSKNIPLSYKGMVIGALGYFILPIDLIPDLIPGIGFTDDLTAMLTAITNVSSAITPDIEQAAQSQVESWLGKNP
ncbi:MAG: DUF1232 domain-containing protein [Cyanobacteriota bacterium]|nr:DUF1232 domain-containing protein [Cyanobacteriota bacterium]